MASKSISAAAQSRSRAVEVVVDSKLEYNGAALKSSKHGFPSAESYGTSSKHDQKRLLLHSDSGYISPTVAPASNGNSPQTPSKGLVLQCVKFQTGTITEDQNLAVETDSVVVQPPRVSENLNNLNHKPENMQSVVLRPSREVQMDSRSRRRSLPSVSSLTSDK